MNLLGRRAVAVLCAGVLTLLLSAHAAPTASMAVPQDLQGETPTAAAKGETRLRKLHLVRPDLIPYPIAFEVYC